ncbi:MAG: tetratricopeptide repeat protein [Candidatus Rokuibacteriota bacterium]
MLKRSLPLSAAVALVLVVLLLSPPSARALDEADRLWLLGERAYGDKLYVVARPALDRFVARHGADARAGAALLLLGKTRLALGEPEAALEAFRRAQALTPPPGQPGEARLWEGEALFRLKRYEEARAAYDEVFRADEASSLAPDALYGAAWSDLEQKKTELALAEFRDFLWRWPQHALAPASTIQAARLLAESKRGPDALALLAPFKTSYPSSPLAPDAEYLIGWIKTTTGDVKGGVAELRRFLEVYPSHEHAAAARKLISQSLAKVSDKDDLLAEYKTLMEQDPATPEALYEAALIAGRLGRPKDRQAAWTRLKKEFPEHPAARRLALDLASSAFKQKNYKDAAFLSTLAAKSDEGAVRAEGWLLLGESELRLKRFTAAAKAFEAVGETGEVETGARFRALAGLGLAREELQEWRAALQAYEAVVSKSPDPALRDWARQRAGAVKNRGGRPPAAAAPKAEKKP